jgi:hypothetical protein
MSKPWLMDPRDRLTRKYIELHAQLRREVESAKRTRKRRRSNRFKRTGSLTA